MLAATHAPSWAQEKLPIPPKDKGDPCCPPMPSLKHLDGRRIVFVANGAGSSTIVSDNLSQLNGDLGLHWTIKPVPWSRMDHVHKDIRDDAAQLKAAAQLACWTAAIRRDAPKAEVTFVGHSVGARVVLAAAEIAGEKSVNRIILLHAAVSNVYDLGPALKASRHGIDSFYSVEDGVLDEASQTTGLADGLKTHAAGRVGFKAPSDPKEAQAYRGLRQYRWTEDLCGSGGHYAWAIHHNLRKVVVPVMVTLPPEPIVAKLPPPKK